MCKRTLMVVDFLVQGPRCVNGLNTAATSSKYLDCGVSSNQRWAVIACLHNGKNVRDNNSGNFVREYDLENDAGTIFLSQKEIGDVNCVVWDAALVLAKYLEKRCLENTTFLEKKRVVELGSGLGCVGLVASYYGADAVLTDLPSAMPQLEANVRSNQDLMKTRKGAVTTSPLDWNEDTTLEPCDILLLADCLYYKESVPGLIKTMVQLSNAATEIYMSQENRSYSETQTAIWDHFCNEIQKTFKMRRIPQRDQHEEYRSADIFLICLTKL